MIQAEIAARLGISRSAVAMRIRKYGTAYVQKSNTFRGPKTHTVGDSVQRRCLCCRAFFRSSGPGNRRCGECEGELGCIRPVDSMWIKVAI